MLCEASLNPSVKEILEKALEQLKEGYFENAIDGFNDYLLIESTDAKAYQGRGLANFQIKNWSAAISDFKKAKELDPDDKENWIGLGMSLAMENKIYEAIDVFEALLKNHPQYARGHIQLGELYYRLGVITKGHQEMDLALASRPSLPERRLIEETKKAQLMLDKKRYHRPDFEGLNKKNELEAQASGALIKKISDFLNRKFRSKI